MLKLRNTYFLMRHEETEKNRQFIISSAQHKFPITARGRANARRAARALRRFPINYIYTSPVRRAEQTAKVIRAACGGKLTTIADLREVEFGKLEGHPWGEYLVAFKKTQDRFTRRFGGVETLKHVQLRMAKVFKDLERRHRGKVILIVSHGDPLWMLKAWLLKLSPTDAVRHEKDLYLVTGEVQELVPGDKQGLEFASLCHSVPPGRRRLFVC
jgi:broad specificity phosphatase PhoE